MNDLKENKKMQNYIIDKTIISMYKNGYSINFIAKKYYKYINKKQKPIRIEGLMYFPPKIYNMEYCKMYVTEVIYNFCKTSYANSKIF